MHKWKIVKNGIIIRNLSHFDPVHTFECGQCFRWNRLEDGKWFGVAKGLSVLLEWDGRDLLLTGATEEDYRKVWHTYFDLDRDYGALKEKLMENDPIMREAVRFGHGMRLLKQDFDETLISFLISQNNGIPRIRKIVESLAREFGEPLVEGTAYAFPGLERLASLAISDLAVIKAGYRDKYIQKAALQLISGEVSKERILSGSTPQARGEMLKLFGVGEKVADCVLLFSGACEDVFPVDRWVKRVMAELYLGYEASCKELYEFALNKFGSLCGYAQQYLFYYAREKKIGFIRR